MHDARSFFSLGNSSRSSGGGRSTFTCSSSSSRRGYSSSSGLSDDQTPVQKRDTVTITTAEIGKVFDAFFLMPSIQYQPSLNYRVKLWRV